MRVGSMSAPVFMSANFQEDDVSICVRDFKICHVMPLIILMVFFVSLMEVASKTAIHPGLVRRILKMIAKTNTCTRPWVTRITTLLGWADIHSLAPSVILTDSGHLYKNKGWLLERYFIRSDSEWRNLRIGELIVVLVEPYYMRGRKIWVKGKLTQELADGIHSGLTLPPVSYHSKNIEVIRKVVFKQKAFVELTDSFSTWDKAMNKQ